MSAAPTFRGYRNVSILDRLMAKVEKLPDGCWQWRGRTLNGYGQIDIDQIPKRAHRVSYELLVGPIPDGLHIDHLCRNRGCVNPDHLEPVTQAENNRRSAGGEVARALHAAVTHCPKGHPYDEENTYWGKQANGKYHNRCCRACRRESMRKRRAA